MLRRTLERLSQDFDFKLNYSFDYPKGYGPWSLAGWKRRGRGRGLPKFFAIRGNSIAEVLENLDM